MVRIEMRTFLIPPLCGDDDDLAAFRDRLKGSIPLELVDLPDAGLSGAILSNMKATANFVSSEIMRRQSVDSIGLIGFSFGASTALEVANQLIAAEYSIAFLGILDGPFASSEMKGWFELFRRASSVKGSARTIAEIAANTDIGRRASWAALSPERIGQSRSDPIRRAMLAHVRGKALKSWVPETCYAEGVLIRTPTFGVANHQRWADLCPNLHVVIVEADHAELIRNHSLEFVISSIEQHFRRVFASI